MNAFLPYDKSVFRPQTWGAIGLCCECKERSATWMQEHRAGRYRSKSYLPLCGSCKANKEKSIKRKLARDQARTRRLKGALTR